MIDNKYIIGEKISNFKANNHWMGGGKIVKNRYSLKFSHLKRGRDITMERNTKQRREQIKDRILEEGVWSLNKKQLARDFRVSCPAIYRDKKASNHGLMIILEKEK